MSVLDEMLNRIPVLITTRKCQRRTHKKKRINKKWRKRYGFNTYDFQPYGQLLMFEGRLLMTQQTLDDLINNKIILTTNDIQKGN